MKIGVLRDFSMGLVVLVATLTWGTASGRAQGGVNIRPISDFINAQGTICTPPPDPLPPLTKVVNGCWDAIPVEGNTTLNFFAELTYSTSPYFGYPWALVDYAGLAAKYIKSEGGPDLNTKMTGQITERLLSDGRAEVTIILFTSNALSWAVDMCQCAGGPGNLLFGSTPDDVVHGASPALGDSYFKIVLINTGLNAPLPDLFSFVAENVPPPGVTLVSADFRSSADGALHYVPGEQDILEGTPGKMTVAEMGPPNGNAFHGFPAAVVNLKPIQ
jgi:hypothetical protein